MTDQSAARVTIVGIAGTALDLQWLQDTRVPAGVTLEIADVGSRVDLVVSRGIEHVALVIDGQTGETIAEQRNAASEELIELAHQAAAGRRFAPASGTGENQESGSRSRILFHRLNWPLGGKER